jgi:hypothetical protein
MATSYRHIQIHPDRLNHQKKCQRPVGSRSFFQPRWVCQLPGYVYYDNVLPSIIRYSRIFINSYVVYMCFYVSFFIHWCSCRIPYVHNRRHVSGVFSPPVSGTFFCSSLILRQELFLNIVPAATPAPCRFFWRSSFSTFS